MVGGWRSACTVCRALCSQLLPLQVRRASFTQPTPLKLFIRRRHDFLLGRRARLCLSVCVCFCLGRLLYVHARLCVCLLGLPLTLSARTTHPLRPSTPSGRWKKDEEGRRRAMRITSEEADVSLHLLHLSSSKPRERAANDQFPFDCHGGRGILTSVCVSLLICFLLSSAENPVNSLLPTFPQRFPSRNG